MAHQKPISVKLDNHIYQLLEAESHLGLTTRNRLINEAVRCYIDYKDTVRLIRTRGTPEEKRECVDEFTKKWFRTERW